MEARHSRLDDARSARPLGTRRFDDARIDGKRMSQYEGENMFTCYCLMVDVDYRDHFVDVIDHRALTRRIV